MDEKLLFKSYFDFPEGTLIKILKASYADLLKEDLGDFDLLKQLEGYEESVYKKKEHLDYGFISVVNGKPIGVGGWGPVKNAVGEVGQNCISPEHKGKGYGKAQMQEILRRIVKIGEVNKIKVTTGKLPFFEPARRMYESCGFRKIREHHDGSGEIDYMLHIATKL